MLVFSFSSPSVNVLISFFGEYYCPEALTRSPKPVSRSCFTPWLDWGERLFFLQVPSQIKPPPPPSLFCTPQIILSCRFFVLFFLPPIFCFHVSNPSTTLHFFLVGFVGFGLLCGLEGLGTVWPGVSAGPEVVPAVIGWSNSLENLNVHQLDGLPRTQRPIDWDNICKHPPLCRVVRLSIPLLAPSS